MIPDRAADLPHQQPACIRRDGLAIKPGHDFPPPPILETPTILPDTLFPLDRLRLGVKFLFSTEFTPAERHLLGWRNEKSRLILWLEKNSAHRTRRMYPSPSEIRITVRTVKTVR